MGTSGSITGFPPGTVNGTTHSADAVAGQAKSDLTAAYDDAAGRTPAASVAGDIGGLTLTPGVYRSGSSVLLTGDLILDAQGDPNAVFIFQIGSTLTTASGSRVRLINSASPCNVYWQVGSSATIGTTTTFKGNVLALTSISAKTGATVDGRLLARNGAVTLENNTVKQDACSSTGGGGTGGGGTGGGGGEGGGGGGFFGGGRVGNLVDAGDYMVTINAGGQSMRQVVHVERVGEILNVDFGPEQDEDGGGDPNDP